MADGKVTILVDVDGKKVKVLTQELEKVAKAGSSGSKDVGKVASELDKTSQKAEQAAKKVKEVNTEIGKTGQKSTEGAKGADNLGNELNDVSNAGERTKKEVRELNEELGKTSQQSEKGSKSLKDFALAGAAFKVAQAGLDLLKSSLDSAISRFDTLQSFPRVMKAMGHSTADVTESTKALADGIEGLPTTLDEVVGTTQRLTSITGDLGKSTKLTLALNNAFLASGASSEDASRGLQQFSQMLSAGKVDMQSWKTLQETMPYALQKTAESFGFAGASAQNDFYAALRDGNITFDQFSKKLMELDQGVGGFAELAKTNSEGIATSFGNLRNAVSKGLANLIAAFDEVSKAVTGKSIAKNIDSLKVVVNASFKLMSSAVMASVPVFKFFFDAIKAGINVAKPLTPLLIGLTAAFVTLKVIQSISALITSYTAATKIMTAAVELQTTVQGFNSAAFLTQQGVLKVGAVAYGLLTGQLSLATVATIAQTAATTALGAAMTALSGPVGWVVAAVGLLVTASVAYWNILNYESEETKKLKANQEELIKETDDLTKSVKNNTKARKEALEDTDKQIQSYRKTADEILKLAAKENKSAAEKKQLQKKIDSLNESMAGLDLAYDKNTNTLSHNSAQLYKRIAAMEAESKWQTAQENLAKIESDRASLNEQLNKVIAQRKEVMDGMDMSSEVSAKMLGELVAKENELRSALENNQVEYAKTSEAQMAAAEAMAQAEEDGANRRVYAYENMSEAQKKAIDDMRSKYNDLLDTTTNMFEQIEMKSAISVDQMIENLQKNQEAMNTWADNLNTLAARGVDEGVLEKLRQLGPQGGLYVQELVNASDEQLSALNSTFQQGGESAMKGLTAGMDEGALGINDKLKGLVQNQATSLQNEIQAADFASIAEEVPNGAAKGIERGSQKSAAATQKMAELAKKEFQRNLDIHSPSRVFDGFGQNIAEGLANGIANNTNNPVGKVTAMASQLKTPFDSIAESFRWIGVNAMSGLTEGLNAGSGSVLATANSIAGQVKSTIQKALDIHSPSRVMRDEVGRYIPQGIAVGIDADADAVQASMERLKASMLISASPETALGLHDSLSTRVVIKQSSKQSIAEKIEVAMDKSNELIARALDAAEAAAKRPVSLIVKDEEIARTTGDAMTTYQANETRRNNRMRGIVI